MKKSDSQKIFTKTIDVISIGLLLNIAISLVTPKISAFLLKLCGLLNIEKESIAYANFSLVIDIILYVLAFLLPALFICIYVPQKNRIISVKPKFPQYFALYVPFALGAIAIVGQIIYTYQALLEEYGIGVYGFDYTIPDDITGIVLLFIISVIVPAVVEEILFRKVILNNLIPYGELFALITVSAAFALMHCNPTQIPYTFVGGIILGTVVIKSRSVVPAIIIHASNNMLSFTYMMLEKYTGEKVYTYSVTAIDSLIKLFGILSFIYLWKKGCFNIKNNENLDFSPNKSIFRISVVFYVLFALFLAMQWVYVI